MKIYILIFFILFASIVVILKLITSPEPVTSPEISLDMKRYDTEESTYQNSDEEYYKQSTNEEIDDLKILAFAKAFVDVQSYMHKAGSKASYNKDKEDCTRPRFKCGGLYKDSITNERESRIFKQSSRND